MKTKLFKTFCLFTFLLVSSTSFGQTEIETKSWLQEKLNKYLKGNQYVQKLSIQVNTCDIVLSFYYNYPNNGSDYKIILPTDQLMVSGYSFSTKGARIKELYLKSDKQNLSGEFTWCKLQEGEIDLYIRVKKAIDHLATFCPKKKETF